MIAFVQGVLTEIAPNRAVVDVGGVGYDVYVSAQSQRALPSVGKTVRLLTYQHVREDALDLFGFVSAEERDLFKMLLSVSGIGPKMAMTILSGITTEGFFRALRDEDRDKLSLVPGIGKKTVERLIVELKDKVALMLPEAKGMRGEGKQTDAVRALLALGYKQSQAQSALEKAARLHKDKDRKPSTEDLIRDALRLVSAV